MLYYLVEVNLSQKMAVNQIISMNIYSFSTFFPTFSNDESGSTMKKVSFTISHGENTDGNVKFSIFDSPKENIEKVVREAKLNQFERESKSPNK